MAFKSTCRTQLSIDSPESLFADIKSKQIPGLLTQQGDVLREYVNRFVESTDLAVQLPTGSGKTLVALLIGEWLRLTRQERVVYLCPTNQLVHQVAQQARNRYGIDVIPFTGSAKQYSMADRTKYTSSQAIAVTSYSSLFNCNPFFNDPHVIILDDAHAAEQYVSSNWTIELNRHLEADVNAFNAVVSVLRPHIDELTYRRLTSEAESSSDAMWIEKLPAEHLYSLATELERVIDANISMSQARYPWDLVRGHLPACNMFFSLGCITVRPYLAPTFSHLPFQNARQRLYISATPGEGGELERIFCRRRIDRLTPPAGSQRHTIGRRFFVFPELALNAEEQNELLLRLADQDRLLMLVGDNKTADQWIEFFRKSSKATVFGAGDIETSKAMFVASSHAVAVLANRYDGIDFPGDECRKSVLVDIPTATNPQERFFITRLGAARFFEARMITRITQSFGRCTRSATDYSVVVVFGDRLVSYLAKKDRQAYFHPELQGEIAIGLEESSTASLADTLENVGSFLGQTEEWKGAEAQIYLHRDRVTQASLLGSADLSSVVQHEVHYVEALWNGDLIEALDRCKSVIGGLADPALRGSRAMWHYFSGSIASTLSASTLGMATQASIHYKAAADAAPSLSWLHKLIPRPAIEFEGGISDAETIQLDGIEKCLLSLGVSHPRDYDKLEAEIRAGINGAPRFEAAHEALGSLLGFSVGKVESSGSPDPWWRLADDTIWVFEDHAGARQTSKLDVTKARQAATHDNWIRGNLSVTSSTKIVKILITPVERTEAGALCHLRDVRVWKLSVFREWVEVALGTLRELRKTLTEPGDLDWRSRALGLLRENNLTPERIAADLRFGADALAEKK